MRPLFLFLLFSSSILTAQVLDDFTDSDFTNNPVWVGDTIDWIIVNGQLRSNSNTPSHGFYLSTPSNAATNVQWEFYVNLQLQTSSANYTDIYLTSDEANLKSISNNGYFVRIGNTSDEISLYKQVSGNDTEIIDGVDATVNSSNNSLYIKVTRDTANLWTLKSNVLGPGFGYVTEGSITDSSITTSNYFGIFVQQSTPTFHLNHFYDNIYVGPIVTDSLPPFIISTFKDIIINEIFADPSPQIGLPNAEYIEIYNNSEKELDLSGWKLSDGATTGTLTPYTLSPQHYLIVCSKTDTALFASFNNVMGISSFPILNNAGDLLLLKNNALITIDSVNYSDTWYHDDTKKAGGWSLELMNPHANTHCPVSNYWKASNNTIGGSPGMVNSTYSLAADIEAPQLIRVTIYGNDSILIHFNETLDMTTALNTNNYMIDKGIGAPVQITATDPDHTRVLLIVGTTLQAGIVYTVTLNILTDCSGNPILPNSTINFVIPESAIANDIVINEILFDPKTDGIDFVEIYNRSRKIIDLKNITVSQYDTIHNTLMSIQNITSESHLMYPGEYIVLSENGATVKSHYETTHPNGFVDMTDLPAMNVTSGTVCLASSTNIIDLFIYQERMHFPLLNTTKGVSLERIDFDRPTSDGGNWHSAAEAVGFATPAYKNSQYHDAGETDDAIEITPSIFSPDEDGMNDIVNVNYHFDVPGLIANVTIYDSKGRSIKQVLHNELLGVSGTFSWDGINENREKEKLGIYIVFMEVIDLSGKVKQYKKTCVLAGKL